MGSVFGPNNDVWQNAFGDVWGVWVFVGAPTCRSRIIDAETRTLSVEAETRVLIVSHEDRIMEATCP